MAKKVTVKELEEIIRFGADKLHSLGDSLYLSKKGNSNRFVFRYQIDKRPRKKSLRAYDAEKNNLNKARAKVLELKAMVKRGIDPLEMEQQEKILEQRSVKAAQRSKSLEAATFESCAHTTIDNLQHEWTNHKTKKQWLSSLKQYAFPVIGHRPVSEITKDEILEILKPIWFDKTETADRVRRRVEAVLRSAISDGLRTNGNPAVWRGCIEFSLPNVEKTKNKRKPKEKRHHKALPYSDLPEFMRELREIDGMGARALEFLILNANRTEEVLKAKWDEIDFETETWTIPANRMKGKVSHEIPLTPRSLGILSFVKRQKVSQYVFPNLSSKKHLSQAGMLSVIKRMGRAGQITVHGFRSTFRDFTAEKTNFSGDIAEQALAYNLRDKTRALYQRGDVLAQHRKLMMDWAYYAYGIR